MLASATMVIADGLDRAPAIDVSALMDYENMKEKLSVEVISADANADLLANVPHDRIDVYKRQVVLLCIEQLIAFPPCYGPASAFAYRLGGSFPLLSEWVVPDSTSYYALSGRAPFVFAMRVSTNFRMSASLWI